MKDFKVWYGNADVGLADGGDHLSHSRLSVRTKPINSHNDKPKVAGSNPTNGTFVQLVDLFGQR